jgi:hypothetical protein
VDRIVDRSFRSCRRYSVDARAAEAGAHFSLIEETVAIGSKPAAIHNQWMRAPDDRASLLNPDVDHVGVGVIARRGVLYAVADFERAVRVLSQAQVKSSIAGLLRAKGLTLLDDHGDARAYCAKGADAKLVVQPAFLMVWQDPEITRLPPQLLDRIAAGQDHQVAVGSCPPQYVEGSVTLYRVAVLLY